MHGSKNVVHHFLCACLGFRREIFLYILFAQRITQKLVSSFSAAFPAWLQFRGAIQILTVKRKVLFHKWSGQLISKSIEELPLQIRFPVSEWRFLDLAV